MNKQIITGLTPKMVQQVVLDITGTTIEDMKSKSRKSRLTFPRHLLMWATYKFTPATLNEIGANLNRDHSSIIYACHRVEDHLKFDKTYQRTISALLRKI